MAVDRDSETYARAYLEARQWRSDGVSSADAIARIVSESSGGASQDRVSGLTNGYADTQGSGFGAFVVRPALVYTFEGERSGFGVFVGDELVAWHPTVERANAAAQSFLTGREPR